MTAVTHLDLTSRRGMRPAASAARTRREPALRLTVRGRRLLVAMAVVVLLCGWGMFRAAAAPAGDAGTVVVQPGQTLSQIAHDALPQLPVREAVVQVQLANGLNTLEVTPGQELRLPA